MRLRAFRRRRGERITERPHHGRQVAIEELEDRRRPPREHPTVPEITSGPYEAARPSGVRLLDEGADARRASTEPRAHLDVAVARFRTGRPDPDRDCDRLRRGPREGFDQRRAEHRGVGDRVVGRQAHERRAGRAALDLERRQRETRRRVARDRLTEDVRAGKLRQLLAHRGRVIAVRDDQDLRRGHDASHACDRFLQQAPRSDHRQQLLRDEPPAARPETRPAASGHDHRPAVGETWRTRRRRPGHRIDLGSATSKSKTTCRAASRDASVRRLHRRGASTSRQRATSSSLQ